MNQHQQLKEAIKKFVKNEMIYNGNVGIAELMDFYNKADKPLVDAVDKLFEEGENKTAWRLVLRFLNKPVNEMIINELNWKSMVAGGLMGAAAIGGNALHHSSKHNGHSLAPTHQQSSVHNIVHNNVKYKSLVDTLKHYENSMNNPKGGYNKKYGKWYPHHSIEGGSDTIAYGHKILPNENFKNGLTDSEAIQLLKADIAAKESLAKSKMPKFMAFPEYVKDAIINAMYRGDLGPKTIKLINVGNWNNASVEYLNHPNYKSGKFPQIKDRMKGNADAFSKYAQERQG